MENRKFKIKGIIVPWKYHTKYRDGSTGKRMFCDWWMWLGKPFCVSHYSK